MPIEFTEHERAALIDLLVGAIENDPFPLSQRTQQLRAILTKLMPPPELSNDEEPGTDDDHELP
jgi:hypothetical protein